MKELKNWNKNLKRNLEIQNNLFIFVRLNNNLKQTKMKGQTFYLEYFDKY